LRGFTVSGKQNIPLCGHHDANSSKSLKKGNFKAILEFRALGNLILQQHLTDGAKIMTQNEAISLCRYVKK